MCYVFALHLNAHLFAAASFQTPKVINCSPNEFVMIILCVKVTFVNLTFFLHKYPGGTHIPEYTEWHILLDKHAYWHNYDAYVT